MRRIILNSILAVFLFIACESENENFVEPSLKGSDSESIVLTDTEVDKLIISEFGDKIITEEEKMNFLLNHIANIRFSEIKNKSFGRTEAWIQCIAGIYELGAWHWTIKDGNRNQFIHTQNYNSSLAYGVFGVSASIYECIGNTCYPYAIYPAQLPALFGCGGEGDIEVSSSARWNGVGTGYYLKGRLDCDD